MLKKELEARVRELESELADATEALAEEARGDNGPSEFVDLADRVVELDESGEAKVLWQDAEVILAEPKRHTSNGLSLEYKASDATERILWYEDDKGNRKEYPEAAKVNAYIPDGYPTLRGSTLAVVVVPIDDGTRPEDAEAVVRSDARRAKKVAEGKASPPRPHGVVGEKVRELSGKKGDTTETLQPTAQPSADIAAIQAQIAGLADVVGALAKKVG